MISCWRGKKSHKTNNQPQVIANIKPQVIAFQYYYLQNLVGFN